MLQGKELSFNNIADTDTALECVRVFNEPACVIVKHANPCGVATAVSLLDAYDRAYRTDPTSAFGGIIAFNRELDAATAVADHWPPVRRSASPRRRFRRAPRRCWRARPNVRVLVIGRAARTTIRPSSNTAACVGGLLVQTRDTALARARHLQDRHDAASRRPRSTRDLLVRVARVQVREIQRDRVRARQA